MLRLLLIFALPLAAEEWTRFRGPNGSGVSSDTGFPGELTPARNLTWRTAARRGKSSPVLTKDRVFLTGAEKGKLYTQCFDRKTGKLLWERAEDQPRTETVNKLNHEAALSPVTDGENVYVFFKDFGMVSYDAAGKTRWKTPLGPFTNTMGLGASPIIAGDFVVVTADQMDGGFMAALDRRNGEIRWKTAREERDGWSTPIVRDGKIITVSRGQFGVHSAATGKREFSARGVPAAMVSSPVMVGDRVYFFGYGNDEPPPFSTRLAKLDKNGDGQLTPDEYGGDLVLLGIAKYIGNGDMIVTQEKWDAKQREILGPNGMMAYQIERGEAGAIGAHELWRFEKGFTNLIPSLVVYDKVVYVVKNGGILTSFNADTGKVFKTGRVEGALGGYSASPVAADGKVYLASEDGAVAVLKAGADWSLLSVTDLGEPCFATPALAGGSVYLRTDAALYRFGR